ncbi:hypothetical protein CH063_13334 [Colletotrichum higginsianum]|uniref:Uncharacterized protein n=1 Tax=Colletotrichum higginsianum (strain IMI 349063) TaxID=759273 RepID=H1VTZ6_COLHI|nr:hypothetical protein CH063_13334 [Colletotrichum higginsianum]
MAAKQAQATPKTGGQGRGSKGNYHQSPRCYRYSAVRWKTHECSAVIATLLGHTHKRRAKKVVPLSVDLPIAKGPWQTGHGPCLVSLSPWRQPVFVALHPKRIPAKGTREDWGKRSSDAGWTEAGGGRFDCYHSGRQFGRDGRYRFTSRIMVCRQRRRKPITERALPLILSGK